MSSSDATPAKRLKLTKQDLEELTKEEIIDRWLEQEQYLDLLEIRHNEGQKDSLELMNLRESEDKLRQQQLEATRRENLLVMRLAAKEQEMQEYANQIQELKQAQTPGSSQLRSTLLDPAVNLMFERMKKELNATKAKLEETQNELSAWKFTPDSNTGKRLMAKCRLLYQENEELGKMISSGRMAKLEGDLALQKNFSEEMKKSQAELDEFLLELDEDVEGMQSTILYLQQQLRESKEHVGRLQSENQHLQTAMSASTNNPLNLPKLSANNNNGSSECNSGQIVQQAEKNEASANKTEMLNCFPNHTTMENEYNTYPQSPFAAKEINNSVGSNKLDDSPPVTGTNEHSNQGDSANVIGQTRTDAQGDAQNTVDSPSIVNDWLTLDKNDYVDSRDQFELIIPNGTSTNDSPVNNDT